MQSNEFRLEGHIISCLGIFGRTYPTHKLSVNTPFAIVSLLHLLHEGLHCLTNRSPRHSVMQPWKLTIFVDRSYHQVLSRDTSTHLEQLVIHFDILCPDTTNFNHEFFDFADNFATHPFWARAIFSSPKIARLHDRVVPLGSDKLHCFFEVFWGVSCLEPAISTSRKPSISSSMSRTICSASSRSSATNPPITIIDLSTTSASGIAMFVFTCFVSNCWILSSNCCRASRSDAISFRSSPTEASILLATIVSISAIPCLNSSRIMARSAAMVLTLISTLLMGSNDSGTRTWGTNCVGWNFERACASRSGVPSGAERFVDDVMAAFPASTIFIYPLSKSALTSCQFAECPIASAMVVACLYFSNLSHALEPAFLGFSIWIEIDVAPFLRAEIWSSDNGISNAERGNHEQETLEQETLSQWLERNIVWKLWYAYEKLCIVYGRYMFGRENYVLVFFIPLLFGPQKYMFFLWNTSCVYGKPCFCVRKTNSYVLDLTWLMYGKYCKSNSYVRKIMFCVRKNYFFVQITMFCVRKTMFCVRKILFCVRKILFCVRKSSRVGIHVCMREGATPLVVRDFNASIGRALPHDEVEFLGSCGCGHRNAGGWSLVDWALGNGLVIQNRMDTTINNVPSWTCHRSFDGALVQLDFVVSSSRMTLVRSWCDYCIFIGLEHRCVHCIVTFVSRKPPQRSIVKRMRNWLPRLDSNDQPSEFQNFVRPSLTSVQDHGSIVLENILVDAAIVTGHSVQRLQFRVSPLLRQLRSQRRHAPNQQCRKELSLQIRSLHRKEVRTWKSQSLTEHLVEVSKRKCLKNMKN